MRGGRPGDHQSGAVRLKAIAARNNSNQQREHLFAHCGVAALALILSPASPALAQTLTLQSVRGAQPKSCAKNVKDCKTYVEVSPGDQDDQGNVTDQNGCTARWKSSRYIAESKSTPTLIWEIAKVPGDTSNYAFEPFVGVAIDARSGNDSKHDLDKPGHYNGNSQQFKWEDKNKRPRDKAIDYSDVKQRQIQFVFVIHRLDANGDVERVCLSGDPVIINRGQ